MFSKTIAFHYVHQFISLKSWHFYSHCLSVTNFLSSFFPFSFFLHDHFLSCLELASSTEWSQFQSKNLFFFMSSPWKWKTFFSLQKQKSRFSRIFMTLLWLTRTHYTCWTLKGEKQKQKGRAKAISYYWDTYRKKRESFT